MYAQWYPAENNTRLWLVADNTELLADRPIEDQDFFPIGVRIPVGDRRLAA